MGKLTPVGQGGHGRMVHCVQRGSDALEVFDPLDDFLVPAGGIGPERQFSPELNSRLLAQLLEEGGEVASAENHTVISYWVNDCRIRQDARTLTHG